MSGLVLSPFCVAKCKGLSRLFSGLVLSLFFVAKCERDIIWRAQQKSGPIGARTISVWNPVAKPRTGRCAAPRGESGTWWNSSVLFWRTKKFKEAIRSHDALSQYYNPRVVQYCRYCFCTVATPAVTDVLSIFTQLLIKN
jgi:hypothetical protein